MDSNINAGSKKIVEGKIKVFRFFIIDDSNFGVTRENLFPLLSQLHI